ncbi:hypothetical protein MHM95_12315 [Pseudoalteromonas sp. CnMc7-15]|uniref:hypothetical protein n=1 Tax=unclassified Pseudoalteromonas TaxID=194690 RepID=UPI001EF6C76E|nr:hypothetical protein [Pseudoalteromonas sp. CnMc7-15]MCG7567064.1 hypothetical protein [Pseudoalteromonas sp. CnMc7-15]
MKVLIRVEPKFVANDLPDDTRFFVNQKMVFIDGNSYLYADYLGTKVILSDYNVTSYEQAINVAPATIALSDIDVSGEAVTFGNGGIWWVAQNTAYTITAKAEGMPDGEMMIIIERIIQGGTVVQDIRAKASIVNEHITINSQFEASGNYQITAERLNQGLATIGAPFRLAFDTVEFDAYVA